MVRLRNDETLAELLRRWREKLGASQAQAARRVGTHQATWSKWERGIEQPTLPNLRQIAESSEGELRLSLLIDAAGVERAAG